MKHSKLTLWTVVVGHGPVTVQRDANLTILSGLELFPIDLHSFGVREDDVMGNAADAMSGCYIFRRKLKLTSRVPLKNCPPENGFGHSNDQEQRHLGRVQEQHSTKVR